jgi:SAM-dependent methyltransferase
MGLKKFARGTNSKFLFLKKSFGNSAFNLLDVGAGNHSASKMNFLFPNCAYYGVDLSKDYNNSKEDFDVMKGFFEMDLTKLDFHVIPDNFFDGIWMVHVIEHLHNGDEVIKKMIPKLKSGGYMYVEYPGKKSLKLPSMNGTLNFYDDDTHVRLYSVPELNQLFSHSDCKVLESGTRRNWYFIMAMPFRVIGHWIKGRKLIGNIFWDLLGFAEFVYARKIK